MRRQFLWTALLTAVAAMPVAADDRWGNSRNRGYGYGRDDNYGAYGRQNRGGNPVRAAMRDLESIFRRARVDGHEADHFRRALRELAEFDQRAARGRFDRGSLNSALNNMADLAQAHQLHPRDRQVIARRMEDLRYLRDRGDRW
jgi:hypothetical protein